MVVLENEYGREKNREVCTKTRFPAKAFQVMKVRLTPRGWTSATCINRLKTAGHPKSLTDEVICGFSGHVLRWSMGEILRLAVRNVRIRVCGGERL